MYIFLGIVAELASIVGTTVISVKAVTDPLINLQNKGYKLDPKVVKEYQEKSKQARNKLTRANLIKGIVEIIVPGLNLIVATNTYFKNKKEFETDPTIQQSIIPMTEEEKELYSNLKSNVEKLGFFAAISSTNEEEELIGLSQGRPLVVDHGLSSLYYDELEPIGYTLDEVKQLNDVTTYSYRIGKIDDKNVAVIGIPNPESSFSRVRFNTDDINKKHEYVKMTEEEAQDKTFAVYPFMNNYKEEVDKVVAEIKRNRIDEFDKMFETKELTQENSITEEKGPVLKKN